MKIKFASLILLLAFVACVSPKKDSLPLETALFQVTSLNGIEGDLSKVVIKVDMEAKTVGGNTGCNTYGADFDIKEDNQIKIGIAKVTKMYCEDEMEKERKFLENLKNVNTYHYDGDALKLTDKDGKELIVAKLMDK